MQYFEARHHRDLVAAGFRRSPLPILVDSPMTAMDKERRSLTRVLQWASDERGSGLAQEIMVSRPMPQELFPVIPPRWEDWDYIAPEEWDVLFVGMRRDVPDDEVAVVARVVSGVWTVKPDAWLALVTPNHELRGSGGVDLREFHFPVELVLLGKDGHLVRPAAYSCLDRHRWATPPGFVPCAHITDPLSVRRQAMTFRLSARVEP